MYWADKLKNIQLCNGSDRSSPEPQINGCTAVIVSGKRRPSAKTVAREFPFNAIAEEFAAEFGGSRNGSHPLVALSWQSIVS
jgi:hypothetical protein